MKHNLSTFKGETLLTVANLVEPSQKAVFDKMVSDATAIPEKLTSVVSSLKLLPEKIADVVKTVLEEPDTDTTALIQDIRNVLSIDDVLAALRQLRDDASEMVAQVKSCLDGIAAFIDAAPDKISQCFEPPCPLYGEHTFNLQH